MKESSAHIAEAGDSNDGSFDYGMALPPHFQVHSMSIIKDPSGAHDQYTSSQRSLLLLSYVSSGEGGSGLGYAVYQLQVDQSAGKYGLVLARSAASGIIPLQLGSSPDLYSPETVAGVFLAGGSFLFDLENEAVYPGECIII